jgi:hypothetical protein
LVQDYLGRVCTESAAIPTALAPFEVTLADLRGRFAALAEAVAGHAGVDAEKKQALADAMTERREVATLYQRDAKKVLDDIMAYVAYVSRHYGCGQVARGITDDNLVVRRGAGSRPYGDDWEAFRNQLAAAIGIPLDKREKRRR